MTRRLIPSGCPILGKVIARRRSQLGLKQRELAELVGASRSAVAMYERGLKAVPSLVLPKIAAALACAFEGARRDHSPHHGAVMRAGRSGVTCRPTGDKVSESDTCHPMIVRQAPQNGPPEP